MSVRLFGALLAGLLAVPLAPGLATASGFLLPPPSAEALGRAGAVAADTDEPAAVWLNPAALAFVEPRAAVAAGGTLLDLGSALDLEDGAGSPVRSRPDQAWLPSLYGFLRLGDRLTAGLGGHVPYGFSTSWPAGWAGSQVAIRTRFFTAAASAVLAARITDRLALAAGVGLLRGDLQVLADLAAEAGGRVDVGLRAFGLGGHVAVGLQLLPQRLHLAAVYHSRAALSLAGDVDFSATNPAFAQIFADQPARLRLTVPDLLTLALLYRPRPGLSLTLELQRASFGVLDQFHLDFERAGTSDLVVERGKRNPLSARAGIQHWLGNWPLALRAGLAFDDSATAEEFQSPFAPDGRRLGLAAGAGYLLGRVKLDLGYQYTHFLAADARSPRAGPQAPPRGTYRTRLHTLALTVGVRGYSENSR